MVITGNYNYVRLVVCKLIVATPSGFKIKVFLSIFNFILIFFHKFVDFVVKIIKKCIILIVF